MQLVDEIGCVFYRGHFIYCTYYEYEIYAFFQILLSLCIVFQ